MIDEHTLGRVIEFPGHQCPGLAMGVAAAQLALRELCRPCAALATAPTP